MSGGPPPLSDHAFHQRLETILQIVEAHGFVTGIVDLRKGTTRYVTVSVDAYGFDPAPEAVFEYEEWFRRTGRVWLKTDYQYELGFANGGRRAFHWHGGSFHFHCREGANVADDHYLGYEVDLLDHVFVDLVRTQAAGRVDCSGLHRLSSRSRGDHRARRSSQP